MTPEGREVMSRRITGALSISALTLVLATGGASGGASPQGQRPPKNLTPPLVSGTARVPNTLSSSTGTWQGKRLKFAYQWLRCDSTGASCGAISGATASTKTLTTADVNYTLRVIVTATNRNGSAAATSAETAVVAPAPSAPPPPPPPPPPPSAVPPSNTALPGISGTAQQGQTVNASTGSWSGTTPMTYAYQWQRCDSYGGACAAISGATAANYVLATADVGRRMRVSVTVSNAAGSATASSVATAVVTSATVTASAWWSRKFESPETLPQPYPFCCGSYWEQLLVSSASTGGQVVDPTNSANHVLRSHVADSSNYADWALVIQNAANSRAYQGSDVWVKFRIYFPTNFRATGFRSGQPNSEFNWMHEFHEDMQYKTKCPSEDPGNIALGVLDSNQYSTLRWRVQIYAGQQASTTNCTGSIGDRDVDGPPIQLGRWYTLLEHVHFSAGSDGVYQLWIDGTQAFSINGPTLFRHPDGTTEVAYIQFGNYRTSGNGWSVPTTWPSDVYFDDVAQGATQASVAG
jgi:Polysaccharide lyase